MCTVPKCRCRVDCVRWEHTAPSRRPLRSVGQRQASYHTDWITLFFVQFHKGRSPCATHTHTHTAVWDKMRSNFISAIVGRKNRNNLSSDNGRLESPTEESLRSACWSQSNRRATSLESNRRHGSSSSSLILSHSQPTVCKGWVGGGGGGVALFTSLGGQLCVTTNKPSVMGWCSNHPLR